MKISGTDNKTTGRSQSEIFLFLRTKIQKHMKENNFTYDKETQQVKKIEK
jgi:hypothetical protein